MLQRPRHNRLRGHYSGEAMPGVFVGISGYDYVAGPAGSLTNASRRHWLGYRRARVKPRRAEGALANFYASGVRALRSNTGLGCEGRRSLVSGPRQLQFLVRPRRTKGYSLLFSAALPVGP